MYLGMDAMNGLLMAVKQVDLPMSSGPNEERKMNMLRALEHEIDLLKSLQHENIVQYLGRFYLPTDIWHLDVDRLFLSRLFERRQEFEHFLGVCSRWIRYRSPSKLWCIRRGPCQALRQADPPWLGLLA